MSESGETTAMLQTHSHCQVNEPLHEKTNNLGFRSGPIQTNLYSHRNRLEA